MSRDHPRDQSSPDTIQTSRSWAVSSAWPGLSRGNHNEGFAGLGFCLTPSVSWPYPVLPLMVLSILSLNCLYKLNLGYNPEIPSIISPASSPNLPPALHSKCMPPLRRAALWPASGPLHLSLPLPTLLHPQVFSQLSPSLWKDTVLLVLCQKTVHVL